MTTRTLLCALVVVRGIVYNSRHSKATERAKTVYAYPSDFALHEASAFYIDRGGTSSSGTFRTYRARVLTLPSHPFGRSFWYFPFDIPNAYTRANSWRHVRPYVYIHTRAHANTVQYRTIRDTINISRALRDRTCVSTYSYNSSSS